MDMMNVSLESLFLGRDRWWWVRGRAVWGARTEGKAREMQSVAVRRAVVNCCLRVVAQRQEESEERLAVETKEQRLAVSVALGCRLVQAWSGVGVKAWHN